MIDSTNSIGNWGGNRRWICAKDYGGTVEFFVTDSGSDAGSITRDRRIDLGRPGVHSSDQVLHLRIPLQQESRRIRASHSVMAHGDDFGIPI